jgi:hypothetical protein
MSNRIPPSRDRTSPDPKHVPLDDELERERLEPGLSTGAPGDAGADARDVPDEGNSNT